uniref:Uncharacterized protein n=1 Tax=Peronospora matthiolae TaxID=2874970 RepID=A0AAV1VI39_9STRA
MEVEEEGRRSPNYRGEACVPESFFDRVTHGSATITNMSGTGVSNWRTLSRSIELSLPLLSLKTREL